MSVSRARAACSSNPRSPVLGARLVLEHLGTEDHSLSVEPQESLSLSVELRDYPGKPHLSTGGIKQEGRGAGLVQGHTHLNSARVHAHSGARLLSRLHAGIRVHMHALHGSYNLHTHVHFHPRGHSLPSWASRMISQVCPCTRVCVHTRPELCCSPAFDGVSGAFTLYQAAGSGLQTEVRKLMEPLPSSGRQTFHRGAHE